MISSQMILKASTQHEFLSLSQQTPTFIHDSSLSQFSITLLKKPETPELWLNFENLFVACLVTGDDLSALDCLNRISTRFGSANERVIGLQALYDEALAKTEEDLKKILENYNTLLKDNSVNVSILKRRAALLRSISRPADAIEALVRFLDAFPTDAEAWCELSDLYQGQGMTSQAVFCLEEAIIISPNAWNLHARIGELLYVSTLLAPTDTDIKVLDECVKRFSRSIELCDGVFLVF
ncbi:Inositol phosphatase SIW14 [Ophidiomyces ophidiicola]|nr:Inositol phosphatase SIW14 [Ophidiomyces ophidiicola]KAI1983425.1 Inositol phosphatase SIW14 [Ophidiomyces ophidiicola]